MNGAILMCVRYQKKCEKQGDSPQIGVMKKPHGQTGCLKKQKMKLSSTMVAGLGGSSWGKHPHDSHKHGCGSVWNWQHAYPSKQVLLRYSWRSKHPNPLIVQSPHPHDKHFSWKYHSANKLGCLSKFIASRINDRGEEISMASSGPCCSTEEEGWINGWNGDRDGTEPLKEKLKNDEWKGPGKKRWYVKCEISHKRSKLPTIWPEGWLNLEKFFFFCFNFTFGR